MSSSDGSDDDDLDDLLAVAGTKRKTATKGKKQAKRARVAMSDDEVRYDTHQPTKL